jgi:hypothetical protein
VIETTLADVERLADQLPVDKQISLLEHVARRVRLTLPSRPPQDLYGIWRDRIPAGFDVDAALKEIRQAWEKEWNGEFSA